VEAQPSSLVKAQTRILDLATRHECTFKHNCKPGFKISCTEGYKPSTNCGEYFWCVNEEWSKQTCPDGLHWDNEVKQGYALVKDDVTPPRMGPYAYKGNQWVGFDDKAMIEQKCNYVKDMGLGGGMVWALDLDDFRNLCGEGSYPLMNTMRRVLG